MIYLFNEQTKRQICITEGRVPSRGDLVAIECMGHAVMYQVTSVTHNYKPAGDVHTPTDVGVGMVAIRAGREPSDSPFAIILETDKSEAAQIAAKIYADALEKSDPKTAEMVRGQLVAGRKEFQKYRLTL